LTPDDAIRIRHMIEAAQTALQFVATPCTARAWR
jgi:hypothetical protein